MRTPEGLIVSRRGFLTLAVTTAAASPFIAAEVNAGLIDAAGKALGAVSAALRPGVAYAQRHSSVIDLLDGEWDSDEWGPWFNQRSELTGRSLLLPQDDPEGIFSEVGRIAGTDAIGEIRGLAAHMIVESRRLGMTGYAGNCYGLIGAMNFENRLSDGPQFSAAAKVLLAMMKHSYNPRIGVSSSKFVDGSFVPMGAFEGAMYELSRGNRVIGRTLKSDGSVWNVKLFLYNGQVYRSAFGFAARPVTNAELEAAYISRHIDASNEAEWANVADTLKRESEGLMLGRSIPDSAVDEVLYTR